MRLIVSCVGMGWAGLGWVSSPGKMHTEGRDQNKVTGHRVVHIRPVGSRRSFAAALSYSCGGTPHSAYDTISSDNCEFDESACRHQARERRHYMKVRRRPNPPVPPVEKPHLSALSPSDKLSYDLPKPHFPRINLSYALRHCLGDVRGPDTSGQVSAPECHSLSSC